MFAQQPAHESLQPILVTKQHIPWSATIQFSPSIYVDEVRKTPGEAIPGSELGDVDNQWQTLGPERYAHRSAHLNPHVEPMPWKTPTRDDPPDQPHFLKRQQHDWDLWEKHRDLVFERKQLQHVDSVWDRVAALAEDIYRYRFTIQQPGGNGNPKGGHWTPMSHPTPTIAYGSWCAGCAPTLVALCATMYVPARMVQILDHAMAEVLVGGQWCLADNSTNMWNGENEMFSRASLAEILLEPTSERFDFTDAQRYKFWQRTAMMYSSNTGRWHEEPYAADLTPQNVHGLYPGWTDPRFKSADPHRYMLLGARNQFTHPSLILRRGERFLRRFWLGSLAETDRLIATFTGPKNGKSSKAANVPPSGGDWCVQINDHQIPVQDAGGFGLADDVENGPTYGVWPRAKPAWWVQLDLPRGALTEHGWNTLAIGCPGSGSQFLQFAGHADAMNPDGWRDAMPQQ